MNTNELIKYIQMVRFGFLWMAVMGLIMATSCSPNSSSGKKAGKVRIVATTDVHGALFPRNFITGDTSTHSLASLTTYLHKEREKPGQELILLDNGDILQGQPSVYYYNTQKNNTTHICAQVMNYMGYDAGSIGNHDIEAGHRVYDSLNNQLDFPWLAANAVHEQSGKPYFTPYTIIERNGVRIAVLGLITPAIHKWLPPVIWEGIAFKDMVSAAKEWVPRIKETEQPDLLLGLFHAGLDYTMDGETAETPKNENASLLVAKQVPGFDMIVAGHDHQLAQKKVVNSRGDTVHIINPGSGATHAGVFTIKRAGNKFRITPGLKKLDAYNADSAFMNHFEPVIDTVSHYVSGEIGQFSKAVKSQEALWGPSAFVDLIHRVQLELSGASISFSAPLALNATIPAGKVRMRDMFKLYRYENLLYTMQLSGREIKDYLEYSYGNWFNTMNGPDDHMLLFKTDSAGNPLPSAHHDGYDLETPYFNFSSAAGILYTVDLRNKPGKRIAIKGLADGQAWHPDSMYQVAINSYRGSGGGGHLTSGAGISRDELQKRILKSTERDLRFYIGRWIRENSPVDPQIISQWKLIPEDWAENAKSVDQALI